MVCRDFILPEICKPCLFCFCETYDGCDLSDVILNVDHEGTPLARTRAGTLTLTPDAHGLKVSATLSTGRGRELWEDIAAGNLDKMSFAFTVSDRKSVV